MTGSPTEMPDQLQSHVKAMRQSCMISGGLVVIGTVGSFFLPRLPNDLVNPMGATLVGAAAALWIAFSANRDARARIDRVKRAFAVHGDLELLFRDFHRTYLVVLLRLLAVAACGVIVTVWGAGPGLGLAFFVLAAILMAMTWPTQHKTRLLIKRAQALRPKDEGLKIQAR